jgi:hypothetical protein
VNRQSGNVQCGRSRTGLPRIDASHLYPRAQGVSGAGC